MAARKMIMYSKTTKDIKISVIPAYLEQHSEPHDNHYVWSYTIQMENHTQKTVKLLNRHWKILDANGVSQEVRGSGVVGEQPTLKPGEAFQYTSGTTLKTPSGIMVGDYEMVDDAGEHFQVDIPAFSLDSPYQPVKLN